MGDRLVNNTWDKVTDEVGDKGGDESRAIRAMPADVRALRENIRGGNRAKAISSGSLCQLRGGRYQVWGRKLEEKRVGIHLVRGHGA